MGKEELGMLKVLMDRLQDIEAIEEEAMELGDVRTFEKGSTWADPAIDQQFAELENLEFAVTTSLSQRKSSQSWHEAAAALKRLRVARLSCLSNWLKLQPKQQGPAWLTEHLAQHLAESCSNLLAKEGNRESVRKAMGPGGFAQGSKEEFIDHEGGGDDGSEDDQYNRLRSTLAKSKFCHLENQRHQKELNACRAWIEQNTLKLPPSATAELLLLVRKGKRELSSTEASFRYSLSRLGCAGEEESWKELDKVRIGKRETMKVLVGQVQSEAVKHFLPVTFNVR